MADTSVKTTVSSKALVETPAGRIIVDFFAGARFNLLTLVDEGGWETAESDFDGTKEGLAESLARDFEIEEAAARQIAARVFAEWLPRREHVHRELGTVRKMVFAGFVGWILIGVVGGGIVGWFLGHSLR